MELNIQHLILFILFSIPGAHSILLCSIRRKRWTAAKKMNTDFVQLGEFQSSEPVPSAEMEVEYAPSNGSMTQHQITDAPDPNVILYNQPDSTSHSSEPESNIFDAQA